MFEQNLERSILFLIKFFKDTKDLIKPTMLHSINTGLYLYNKGYNENICIGGILHDILEDTFVTEENILNSFGEEVLTIIKANTKNKNINKDNIASELIERCSKSGENALIVKAADIIDNYNYYSKIKSEKGIQRCLDLSKLILKCMSDNYKDNIFLSIKKITEGKY